MPSALCDLGLGPSFSLSEYADNLFLDSALNSSCNLEHLNSLFLGPSPTQSPSHPSSEDSFYPPDNTPVLSDEIWKKFDLPEDEASSQWTSSTEASSTPFDWNSLLPPGLHSAMSVVLETGKGRLTTAGKELRNHDCMWAGECKNKEHVRNRSKTTAAGGGCGDQRVVAPGQTLLKNPVISKETPATVPSVMMKAPSPMLTASPTVRRVPRAGVGVLARSSTGKSVLVRTPSRPGSRPGETMTARVVTVRLPTEEKDLRGGKKVSSCSSSSARSFCSEGSSPRPETPLSLSEEEDEEGGTARCDASWGRGALGARAGQSPEDLEEAEAAQALAEAMALAAEEDEDCGEAVSMTEVTGQVRMSGGTNASAAVTEKPTNACYLDHDYHKSNNSNTKGVAVKTDHLGVQTPSDSEEEIDVVSWTGDKAATVRPSAVATTTRTTSKTTTASGRQSSGRVNLPTNPSARDKHQLQLSVEAAIAKSSANASFEDEDDEEYGDSDEEEEKAESEDEVESEDEEEEEEYEEYDSSESARDHHHHHQGHHSSSRSSGGKTSSLGAKRHASDDSGPVAKQSRVGHHHKRKRKQPRDEDPDYDGHSTSNWSFSNYLSSSSSGTASPPRRRGGHRKRPHRHQNEGGDSAPEDPLERRSMHNTMERQRRIDLRNAFENLRLLVPAVSEKERAAKVTILREAAGFCVQLTTQGSKQVDSIKALRAKQVALRAQVSSLRRSLAASR